MNRTVLVFAPHPDDEILGCGGVIAKRKKQGFRVIVCVATSDGNSEREKEENESASLLGVDEVVRLGLPDMELDRIDHKKLTGMVLGVIEKYRPEEVYSPYRFDLHNDHRALAEAVLVAIRPKYKFSPKRVLSYETLSETGWNFQDGDNFFKPNVYEDISGEIDAKVMALEIHESQIMDYPSPRSSEGVRALSMHRGVESETMFAEAFCLVREYVR